MARRYMQLVVEKRAPLVLAADETTMVGMRRLLELVADRIVVLKTHVDLIEDWSASAWSEFIMRARELDVLVFEDRKFADIAKISELQMAGVYGISDWADMVTAHLISGADIISGLKDAWKTARRDGGVLLLAQMSSRGNLLDEDYSKAVISAGRDHQEDVMGYIGNGSDTSNLSWLRDMVGDGQLIFTPGINIEAGKGDKGQRYGNPRDAILAGSDSLIVGSGIHAAESPDQAASEYADAGWKGLQQRMGS